MTTIGDALRMAADQVVIEQYGLAVGEAGREHVDRGSVMDGLDALEARLHALFLEYRAKMHFPIKYGDEWVVERGSTTPTHLTIQQREHKPLILPHLREALGLDDDEQRKEEKFLG